MLGYLQEAVLGFAYSLGRGLAYGDTDMIVYGVFGFLFFIILIIIVVSNNNKR